jgi:hypothetical protein
VHSVAVELVEPTKTPVSLAAVGMCLFFFRWLQRFVYAASGYSIQ